MQAYGLQADGKLDVAENLAEKAVSMNGNDRWACTFGFASSKAGYVCLLLTLT